MVQQTIQSTRVSAENLDHSSANAAGSPPHPVRSPQAEKNSLRFSIMPSLASPKAFIGAPRAKASKTLAWSPSYPFFASQARAIDRSGTQISMRWHRLSIVAGNNWGESVSNSSVVCSSGSSKVFSRLLEEETFIWCAGLISTTLLPLY